jgi:predicted ArsR family transcriptional regulator
METVKNHEGRRSRPVGPLGPRPAAPERPLAASPAAILQLLVDRAEPLSQAALVRATGLHASTVREHVESLVRRGLVARTRAAPEGRGRPAWLYAPTAADPEVSEYAALAAVLATAVARSSASPGVAARLAGEEWGRDLARDRGTSPGSPEEARERVVRLLEDLGFGPQAEPGVLRLTSCPLLDAARRRPEVVCAVHLGLVRGALAEHGADPAGTGLTPFAEPGACLLTLPAGTHPAP